MDETSQVPRKERLHVLKVFDCARFISCKPFAMRRCCLLVSALDRHLGIGPVSQLNTRPVVSPVNASRLASRTEPRASLGVGAVGYSLPREGLSPPILCQLVLALAARVESRMGAVAWGLWPTPRFPSPLIDTDMPISGIRLSDRLHREAHDGAVRGRRSRRSRPRSP